MHWKGTGLRATCRLSDSVTVGKILRHEVRWVGPAGCRGQVGPEPGPPGVTAVTRWYRYQFLREVSGAHVHMVLVSDTVLLLYFKCVLIQYIVLQVRVKSFALNAECMQVHRIC